MPLLPLREMSVRIIHHLVIPLFVGRDKSVKALALLLIQINKIHASTLYRKPATKDEQCDDYMENLVLSPNLYCNALKLTLMARLRSSGRFTSCSRF